MESIRDFVCPHGMKQEEELLMGEARLRELSENYPEKSEKPENVIEQDLLKSIHLDADGQPRISSRTLAKILGISHEKLVKLIEDNREELERLGPRLKDEDPPPVH